GVGRGGDTLLPTPPLIPFATTLPLQGRERLEWRPVGCADQVLDLLRVRTEIVGELVEIGIGDLLEAGLVDVGDDLDAHLLELHRGRMLELEGTLGLLRADIPRRDRYPLLLLRGQTLAQLLA